MRKILLNGSWELFPVSPDEPEAASPEALDGLSPIPGQVPGNIELDLFAAGRIGDPFIGENARAIRPFEFYDFWYRKRFRTPEDFSGPVKLVFEGLDCFADIYLNRRKIGSTDNALISHTIPVTLAPENEENELAVRIRSAEIVARDFPDEPGAVAHMKEEYSSLWVRKPVHSYGWDIAPRMPLGGLWKDVVLLKEESPFYFREVWLQTLNLKEDGTACLHLYYDFAAVRRSLDGFTLKIRGVCGDSRFEVRSPAYFTSGKIYFELASPKLWFPKGYGEPNLYHLHAALYDKDGGCAAEFETDQGIRTVELKRTELNMSGQGEFSFRINGIPVRARGSNHVPFDALHSRDKDRMEKVLELFEELHCNMIRCWGGGVYESDGFFGFCDRHGIMVWQDFMMACAVSPLHPDFLDSIRKEAEWAVRKHRGKTSLVLWCGDNECDQYAVVHRVPVESNAITRKVLPEVLRRLDPTRPYLPSSPYIPPEAQKHGREAFPMVPECHLWGARETFKLPYYSKSGAKFISETGWHGCPNRSLLERFLTPEHRELNDTDPEWDFHASNPFGEAGTMAQRSRLIGKQLQEYFDLIPTSLDQYIKASQIFQAEAVKFMIETARLDPSCTGILWWNVIDCWPQFSDSVVDYYFGKKLAFHYIRRIQEPFCILCAEPDPWESRIMAVNDSREPAKGSFSLESEGSVLLDGTFELAPYARLELGRIRSPRGANALWLIRWNNRGRSGVNHYISGNLTMNYDWYCSILPAIAALDGSFDPDQVGR